MGLEFTIGTKAQPDVFASSLRKIAAKIEDDFEITSQHLSNLEELMVSKHIYDNEAPATPHWSYGGFSHMRENLAQLEGITLRAMIGFGGDISWNTVTTPLEDLLNHSDCEGTLSADQCKVIFPRLQELAPQLTQVYDRENCEMLAMAMQYCDLNNKNLIFC